MQSKSAIKLLYLISLFSCFTTGNILAQNSFSAFEQALEKNHWSIERTEDGGLILSPRTPDKDTAVSAGKNMDAVVTEKAVSQRVDRIDNAELTKKLQARGWNVQREADGSLLIKPKAPTQVSSPVVKAAAASSTETTEPATSDNGTANSFQTMQKKLQGLGWSISHNADGDILLYPPKKPSTEQPPPCPGSATSVDVSLPVDSWQEAHDIARGWLVDQSGYQAAVGKIRKILNVYIISIVSEKAPFKLQQQIAIRNSDGAVGVLN